MAETEHFFKHMKKCVTFIFVKNGEVYQPLGTGFFASTKVGKTKAIYLITANHVLESSAGKYHDKIYIRLNKKDGSSGFEEIVLKEYPIHRHTDVSVDIAAFICCPPSTIYEYVHIDEDYLATHEIIENRAIAEGDEIFFVGLFTQYYGKERNHPIMRFGKVSLMTNEKIEVNQQGQQPTLANVYLFECQSLGAFSGAPVFYILSPFRYNIKDRVGFSGQVIYLAGVMMGHYNDLRREMNDSVLREMHQGIALVTPSQYLSEILNGKEAIEVRTELAKQQGYL